MAPTLMMRQRILGIFFITLMLFWWPLRLLAAEGMWLPDTLNALPLDRLKKLGLKLKPEEIYSANSASLADAVVMVGGGTGEFVSPDGLILTNHHVAYEAIAAASTPELNYLEAGFLAKTREAEIPAKGYTVSITRSFNDVTADVLSVVKDGMSPEERQKAINARIRQMAAAASNDKEGITAQVVEMLNGLSYYLYTYLVLKDVRLVYAPPESIGNFGGDPDNFQWPRHTGDFSFLRAYVGPDGKPAEYDRANVPYRPKKYLPISMDGYKEGDFVMVLGYPGATYRYRESFSIEYRQNHLYPWQIQTLQRQIALLEQASRRDPASALRYSSELQSLNNALKNFQGSLQGLKRSNLLERRRAEEAAFMQYLEQTPGWKAQYGDALPQLANLYRDLMSYQAKQNVLSGLLGAGSTMTLMAAAWDRARDRDKQPEERSSELTDEAIEQLKKSVPDMWRDRNIELERGYIELFLQQADALPSEQKIACIESLFSGNSGAERRQAEAAWARQMLETSRIQSADDVIKLFDMSAAQLQAIEDPLLSFVGQAKAELAPLDERYRQFVAGVTKARPAYIQGMTRWKKTGLYPDANRTLRFTYGVVKGYRPRDAVFYEYMTTLRGVMEKASDEHPFKVPQRLKELFAQRDFGPYADRRRNDVPVAFISDTDITGGNSGSPIMNGKGELIGVVFDGNYEGLGSDYVFNPALSRCIAVDIRYVLFVTEKLGGAHNVIQELQARHRAAGSK